MCEGQAKPMVQPRLKSSWNDGRCGPVQPVQSNSDKPDPNAVIQLMTYSNYLLEGVHSNMHML